MDEAGEATAKLTLKRGDAVVVRVAALAPGVGKAPCPAYEESGLPAVPPLGEGHLENTRRIDRGSTVHTRMPMCPPLKAYDTHHRTSGRGEREWR